MNLKIINRMWSISLMVIGIATIFLVGANVSAIKLPDMIVRSLGIIDLLSLPVLAFSTVKRLKVRSKIDFYRAVIHQQVTARFGYFDEWFDEAAFGNTNLKREF